MTDHQYALIDGHLRHVPRGVDEYLELLADQERKFDDSATERLRAQSGEGIDQTARMAKVAKTSKAGSAGRAHELRKQIRSLERKMHTLDNKIEQAQAKQLEVDPSDYVELGKIQESIQGLQTDKSALEDQWFDLNEQLEKEE